MPRIINQFQHRDSGLTRSSESGIKLGPAILLVIVILSAIFFIYGIIHFLFRLFIKRKSLSSVSHSTPYQENSSSSASLPESGVDHSAIDALPVFHYKNITGLMEPLDCAVCLCEFTKEDSLKLIPSCNHAFHSKCTDTWLKSTSACPLCRTTFSSDLTMVNPLFDFNGTDMEYDKNGEKKLLSVRLGKFRRFNKEGAEIGGFNLEGRGCFLMGSLQYVMGDSDLQVALFDVKADLSFGTDKRKRSNLCHGTEGVRI